MKFLKELSADEMLTLEEARRNHKQFRVRNRAHALLLSARGYSIVQLQNIFDVGRDAVSSWLNGWEVFGIIGLFDGARSGRPRIHTPEDLIVLKTYVSENPHQLKEAVARLEDEIGKVASIHTHKRSLKRSGYTWKRCRHSLKSQRDEEKFRQEQIDQEQMKKYEDEGKVKLYYFDGSGFSTTSSIPYAWQAKGKNCEIPCKRSKRLNVLGFMSRKNESYFHILEGNMASEDVIVAFDGFASQYANEYEKDQVPGVVLLDNASIHHSKAVKQRQSDWMQQGVFLHFLPTYSPELNLIEILWRKVKYEWLPISAYKNYKSLKESVLKVLDGFGIKHKITFA